MEKCTYKRVMLKISGEALSGANGFGFDFDTVSRIAKEVKEIVDMGIEVGLVVGGGNIWRGRSGEGMDRTTADHMGMLATCINALALQSAIEKTGIGCRVLSALEIKAVAETYIRRRAIRHLEKGRVVIFAGGTGNPYFTTDTCATLRAMEIEADAILMAKNGVDGVYTADPKLDKNAQFIKTITFDEMLKRELRVMDPTAIALLKDNQIEIRVFDMNEPTNIEKLINGEDIGTTIIKGE